MSNDVIWKELEGKSFSISYSRVIEYYYKECLIGELRRFFDTYANKDIWVWAQNPNHNLTHEELYNINKKFEEVNK